MQCCLQVGLSACRKHEVLVQIQTGGGGRRRGINRARGPQEPRPARAKQNKELPGVQFRPTTRKIGHSDGYRNKSRKGDDLGNESEGIDRDRDKERERERERERDSAQRLYARP